MTPIAVFDLTTAVVGVLGGGFFAGVGALLKVRPERDAVVVTSAQGALLVQSEVLEDLKEERTQLREDLQHERSARETCEKRLRTLQDRLTNG